ncbi:MAG: flagellar hook-basal body complex protein FliE [Sulfuricurvum sp.]|jgi:flagellar hook-basal body complex protein FliE|uniref:Flagellar hook-basal body complex protein FliE n=1 Tax=Sulfuricurvum kujiense TaxID=148813 RepID=A0A2D3WDX5_9BACT|nr:MULTISPECIES: flagellar hook-basal body complex protein FliE [Sulfuricurvum]OHD79483.1 MAG: flagellar hook-basal body complex protein FliE [Sulfuricurvum sp. GWF2_44_89]MDO9056661.1 flagellar hook-basal body complex protein FliE [Sulfuricurvum sp.]MDP2851017.1 flagellar hook-basal body complex protein FliE [Sulfuricurvum sp.]MDP3292133.1 flagellar hook-basal body complex protein FliE [Sulfuricurvum sp.]OHD94745.1 MAG: flagellar hook-basal body complex protein FliE [Sulfuricurvum sp. RIFOXYD
MANIQSIKSLSTADLLANKSGNTVEASSTDFAQELKNALGNVNQMQVDGERAMSDIATGSVKDLHQAAIAIDKAEISMKLMLEVRNKALNAYKEITRTQM